MNCSFCGHPMPKEKSKCASCKMWTWASASEEDASVLFEDIRTEDLKRLKTGLFDECLCGGMVVSMIALIAGTPGAGKSTALLQVAERLGEHGKVMYIATEEDVKIIRMRGDRLKIRPRGQLRMVPAMGGVADIGELLMKHKPKAIIVDSLDSLTGHDHDAEVKALEIIKKYAVTLQAVAIVVSQVNKEGDFTGVMAKQHAVDVLITLSVEEDIRAKSGDAVRIAEVIKNRNGKAYQTTAFEMTERGLKVCDVTQLLAELEE